MQQDGPKTPYEVYCNHCQVTFPVGVKNCVHCGRRLGRERFQPTLGLPAGSEEVLVEEEAPRRSGISPITVIWVVLLIGGYLYRSCSTG